MLNVICLVLLTVMIPLGYRPTETYFELIGNIVVGWVLLHFVTVYT